MQLEIDSIGQQKATLSDWKKENKIYTFHAPHMVELGQKAWSCWDEFEDHEEFACRYSYEAMGYGSTEKEAVIEFCNENKIELPFWW